jgi:dihydrofolate reductase
MGNSTDMRIVVINHVSLDNVMQGPGRADEDTRNGFTAGGWAASNTDDVLLKLWGERFADSSGYLFGRHTYDGILGFWNTQDSPFKDALNAAQKFVVSNSLTDAPYPNTTIINGDVAQKIKELKAQPGKDLHIMGSGELIRFLGPLGLIDEYMLSINPIVLGAGQTMFDNKFPPTTLTLAGSTSTPSGVIVATYTNR